MLGLEKWIIKKPIEKWTVLDDCGVPLPNLEGGPWIIGGAALEFMQTRDFQNTRDIDYFFKSYNQFSNYATKFKRIKGAKYDGGYDAHYKDKNYNIIIGEYTFNLIGFGFAATAEIIADSFDFTVCQVWTDGRTYEYRSERTLNDIENKILSFTETKKRSIQVSDRETLKSLEERIKKYRDKGFNPDEQMIEFILKYL